MSDAVHIVVRDPESEVAERVRVPPLDGTFLPAYRLATDVPDHWFPLKPIDPGTAESYWFRLALMLDVDSLDYDLSDIPSPMGEILEDSWKDDKAIYEEEVTRAGVELTRSYQLARWVDGSIHLWSGRRAGTGRGGR